ncbi:Hypothetical predicted protein, partial [Paramuricea clavata]
LKTSNAAPWLTGCGSLRPAGSELPTFEMSSLLLPIHTSLINLNEMDHAGDMTEANILDRYTVVRLLATAAFLCDTCIEKLNSSRGRVVERAVQNSTHRWKSKVPASLIQISPRVTVTDSFILLVHQGNFVRGRFAVRPTLQIPSKDLQGSFLNCKIYLVIKVELTISASERLRYPGSGLRGFDFRYPPKPAAEETLTQADHGGFDNIHLAYGLNESSLALFRSYFKDRKNRVRLKEATSAWEVSYEWMSARLKLWTVLWNIFQNDLSYNIESELHMYADDNQFYE